MLSDFLSSESLFLKSFRANPTFSSSSISVSTVFLEKNMLWSFKVFFHDLGFFLTAFIFVFVILMIRMGNSLRNKRFHTIMNLLLSCGPFVI